MPRHADRRRRVAPMSMPRRARFAFPSPLPPRKDIDVSLTHGCAALSRLCLLLLSLRTAQPFVDETHYLQAYFPDREYAIAVPLLAMVAAGTLVLAFIGQVMVKSRQSKVKKQ